MPIYITMIYDTIVYYIKTQHVPWWKKPEWLQLIVSLFTFLFATMVNFLIVWSSLLAPNPIDEVPQEFYEDFANKVDIVQAETYNLQLDYDNLLDSIEYLNNTPLELDIQNLVQPPASFRLIADSLESLIQAGLVVNPEMLLKIGNASFALGNYERAERFYCRVIANGKYLRNITYFMIAIRNSGIVSGIFGNDEDCKRQFDYVDLYSKLIQFAYGNP